LWLAPSVCPRMNLPSFAAAKLASCSAEFLLGALFNEEKQETEPQARPVPRSNPCPLRDRLCRSRANGLPLLLVVGAQSEVGTEPALHGRCGGPQTLPCRS